MNCQNSKKLDSVFGLYPQYDRYYVTACCKPLIRKKFTILRRYFEPYKDLNVVIDAKINFDSRAREMYICYILVKNKFLLHSWDQWPDFIVWSKMYIECIIATQWDGEYKVERV